MEGKDRWEQKGRIFLSFFISLTLLSIAGPLPICLHSLPTIYHPTTLVHQQHRILCSLWTSNNNNTRLASPILTEDTSGMVRSATDDDKGTAPPKPFHKLWTMGSIQANDKGFLEWRQDGCLMSHGLGVREAMVVYLDQLHFESSQWVSATNAKWRSTMLGFFRRSLGTLKKTR